jgi:hypothetical protein
VTVTQSRVFADYVTRTFLVEKVSTCMAKKNSNSVSIIILPNGGYSFGNSFSHV